jgi:hypothetical protein
VAELADARVSEARDGNIVEVQVFSSALNKKAGDEPPAFLFKTLTVESTEPLKETILRRRSLWVALVQ